MDIINITVTAVINHGSIIQVVGVNDEGEREVVSGDWRPMVEAIEGLGIEVGSRIGVGVTEEGQTFLTEEE